MKKLKVDQLRGSRVTSRSLDETTLRIAVRGGLDVPPPPPPTDNMEAGAEGIRRIKAE